MAVLPLKQYAVAVKEPLLRAADPAAAVTFLSDTVFLTNFFSSVTKFETSILLFSFNCESFAELRAVPVLVCAYINTTNRPISDRMTPPLTRFFIQYSPVNFSFPQIQTNVYSDRFSACTAIRFCIWIGN